MNLKYFAPMMAIVMVYQPAAVIAQNPTKTLLQDGTPVRMRINRTISSADAKVGDNVDFEVLDEIKVGDVVLVPKGALALATVTEAVSKRSMGRAGKLNVNVDHLRLADGEKVPLRGIKEAEGGGHVGAMTGAIVATSIVFFPAAPLFLFMHGKDITIPKGTEVTVYVNGDFDVDTAKLHQNTATTPTAAAMSTAATAPAAADFATVAINSNPDGVDITVDGKYVGNAPATVRLSPGDHIVSLEKAGFKTWQKSISTSAGSSLTITPTLEKVPVKFPAAVTLP